MPPRLLSLALPLMLLTCACGQASLRISAPPSGLTAPLAGPPAQARMLYLAAQVHLGRSEWAEAVAALERARLLDPHSPAILLALEQARAAAAPPSSSEAPPP